MRKIGPTNDLGTVRTQSVQSPNNAQEAHFMATTLAGHQHRIRPTNDFAEYLIHVGERDPLQTFDEKDSRGEKTDVVE